MQPFFVRQYPQGHYILLPN